MLTMESPSTGFGIRLKERQYPSPGPDSAAVAPDAEFILDDDGTAATRTALVAELISRLPFLSLAPLGDKSVLFAHYVDSLSVLQHCRSQVQQLFRAMIETTLDVDAVEHPESHAELLDRLLQDARVTISPPPNLATAEMAALHAGDLQPRLRHSLLQAVDRFVDELLDGLGILVDRSVAGLVQWTSPNTVKYHFFRRRVEQTGVKTRRKRGRVQRRTAEEAWNDVRQWKRVNRKQTTTQFTCWLAHHKHDTVDAIQTDLENSQVIMPSFVQDLVEQIPDWMRPSIGVVDGYLIRQQISERELCSHTVTQTVMEEELLHGHEPAITLGPYVLTGWGPHDIAIEQERRAEATGVTQRQQSIRFWGLVALGCQLFCFVFAQLGIGILAAGLFVAGITSLGLCVGHLSQQIQPPVPEWKLQRIGLSGLLFFGGLQSVLTPVSAWLFIAGLLFLGAGLAMWHRDRSLLISFLSQSGVFRS